MKIFERIAKQLAQRASDGSLRQLPGQLPTIDFCSNDYLGLAQSASTHTVSGQGSTGSRLISGDRDHYQQLEATIAGFHRAESALIYPSGYTANLGLLACLPARGDTIFYDELIHASLRDGIRLSPAKAHSFRHNDLSHLAERLLRTEGPTIVVTESLFSMDGDLAPLQELAVLCKNHQALLIVDEAHSVGLFGQQGAGLIPALELEELIPIRVVTYGKAFGAHGAAVLGPKSLRDYLINYSRPFIYSTAPGPAFWQAIEEGYRRLQLEQANRWKQLQDIIQYFRQQLPDAWQAQLTSSNGPIQILRLPGNEQVMRLELSLQQAGIAVKAIRHPTVAAGQERLRLCLHSFNTVEELDFLFQQLSAHAKMLDQ